MSRIVIISTAYPLRGGIAQYTGILANYLKQQDHNVNVITFSRQYPNILFPGKTQIEKDNSLEIESEPIIDSINYFSWIKAARRVCELKPDLLIFKYWIPFFAPCYGTIIRFVKDRLNVLSRFESYPTH